MHIFPLQSCSLIFIFPQFNCSALPLRQQFLFQIACSVDFSGEKSGGVESAHEDIISTASQKYPEVRQQISRGTIGY